MHLPADMDGPTSSFQENMELGLVFAVPAITALAPYVWLERRFRVLWAGHPLAPVTVRADPYRGARVVPGHTQKAPGLVRLAAVSCFFLGQMFLPGLLLGVVGLVFYGLGLVAVPGLIVAARLWAAGVHLLRGTPESVAKARSAARWSVQLNALISVVCITGGLFALAAWTRTEYYGRDDLEALLVLIGFTQAYALLSFGQAALIARATRGLSSSDDAQYEDVLPAWIRAALRRKDARRAA